MSDKPKRFTWEELVKPMQPIELESKRLWLSNHLVKMFNANEPYIDWQNLRIEELERMIDRLGYTKLLDCRELLNENK